MHFDIWYTKRRQKGMPILIWLHRKDVLGCSPTKQATACGILLVCIRPPGF